MASWPMIVWCRADVVEHGAEGVAGVRVLHGQLDGLRDRHAERAGRPREALACSARPASVVSDGDGVTVAPKVCMSMRR